MFSILKVQSPAISVRLGKSAWRFGAHNFLALADPDGAIVHEHHAIARGRGGADLQRLGGVLPFRDEVLWGEVYPHRTGFYDEAHPQAVLYRGPEADVRARLEAAEGVRRAINARNLPYPWPAFRGRNSNAYFRTLLVAMDLPDTAIAGGLWAPGSRRPLLSSDELARLDSPEQRIPEPRRSLANGHGRAR